MENRLGSILILIENLESVGSVNEILSLHNRIILGRQGIPLHDRGVSIISIVIEATTDEIGSLTGRLGRIDGVQIKSVLAKNS